MRAGVRLLPLWREGRRLWRCAAYRSTRMAWKGTIFGALIGLLLTRSAYGRAGRRPHRRAVRSERRPGAFLSRLAAPPPRSRRCFFAPPSSSWVMSPSPTGAYRRRKSTRHGGSCRSCAWGRTRSAPRSNVFERESHRRTMRVCASSSCARPAVCASTCWPHSSSCNCARPSPATAFHRRRARILMRAAERLGMSELEFARMEAAVRARYAGATAAGDRNGRCPNAMRSSR